MIVCGVNSRQLSRIYQAAHAQHPLVRPLHFKCQLIWSLTKLKYIFNYLIWILAVRKQLDYVPLIIYVTAVTNCNLFSNRRVGPLWFTCNETDRERAPHNVFRSFKIPPANFIFDLRSESSKSVITTSLFWLIGKKSSFLSWFCTELF